MKKDLLQPSLFEGKAAPDLVKELENLSHREQLAYALSLDLGFHGQSSNYLTHDFHAFPAKFPPQLPHLFIESLTCPGDTVLDPMMGSGTTILEACRMGRSAVGFDIDPPALLLCQTKISPLEIEKVHTVDRKKTSGITSILLRDETRFKRDATGFETTEICYCCGWHIYHAQYRHGNSTLFSRHWQ
jgi:hypothetical protein